MDATDNTVMTRTFSKIFGLGGMRIGWCYAPPAIVDVLNRVRGPFNVSVAAQAAAIAALAEPGWVEKGCAHNAEYRPKLAAGIEAAGLKVWPSEGNFVLVDLGTTEAAERRRCVPAHQRHHRAQGRRLRPAALPAGDGRDRRGSRAGGRRLRRIHAAIPWLIRFSGGSRCSASG